MKLVHRRWRNMAKAERTELFLVPACLLFTLLLFGPIELYLTNRQEFWFSIRTLLPVFGCTFVILSAFCSAVLFLLPRRVSGILLAALLTLTVCIYIDGVWLSQRYPLLTGNAVDWQALRPLGLLTAAVWVLIAAVVVILYLKFRPLFITISFAVPGILLTVELSTLLMLLLTGNHASGTDAVTYYYSSRDVFSFSKQENVIVLMVDALEGPRFEDVCEYYGVDKAEAFPGFIYYPDTTGIGEYTQTSLTRMLTGNHFPVNVSQLDAIEQCFAKTTVYDRLSEDGFITRLFTYDSFATKAAKEKIDNLSELSSVPHGIMAFTMSKQLMKLTLYRYMPHHLKKYFMRFSLVFDQDDAAFSDQYYVDDLSTWNLLEEDGIRNNVDWKLYSFYTFYGAHAPFRLTRERAYMDYDSDVNEEYTVREQVAAVLNIIQSLFEKLRAAGLYEDAAIIVLADHGSRAAYRFNPVFMVKFPGESKGFAVSETPVSTDMQYLPLILGIADGSCRTRDEFEALCAGNETRTVYRYDYSDRWEGAAASRLDIDVNGPAYDPASYSIDLYQ